jgi:hypothetical protein
LARSRIFLILWRGVLYPPWSNMSTDGSRLWTGVA